MNRHCSAQVPKRQWNAGASSAQASLSFSGRRVAWGRYGSSTVLRKPPSYQSVLLLLLLLISVDLAPPGIRLNTVDSFKSKTGVDNKRHTNAHQPLTSHSPTGVSIPPSPPDFPSCVFRGWFSAKHEAGEVVEPYLQGCLDGDWKQIHLDWTFSVVATPSRSASLFRSQFCSYVQRTSAFLEGARRDSGTPIATCQADPRRVRLHFNNLSALSRYIWLKTSSGKYSP